MVPTEGSRNNPRYYTLDRQKPDWGCDDSTRLSQVTGSYYFFSLENHVKGKGRFKRSEFLFQNVRISGYVNTESIWSLQT